jgi:hypothetical protein
MTTRRNKISSIARSRKRSAYKTASKSAINAARGVFASKSAHRSFALALSGGVLHRHHGL